MILSRVIGCCAVALVTLGAWAGFAAIGSPRHARDMAFDARREGELVKLAAALAARAAARGSSTVPAALPRNLVGPRADGSSASADPQTHEPYEYRPVGTTHYELCAKFALATDPHTDSDAPLRHAAGRTCFCFDIQTSRLLPACPEFTAATTAGPASNKRAYVTL